MTKTFNQFILYKYIKFWLSVAYTKLFNFRVGGVIWFSVLQHSRQNDPVSVYRQMGPNKETK